jgi:precorrin-4/cobalt-precorrin-4 C11-methyltransferase
VKAERLLRGARCCIYAGSLVAETIVGLLPADSERHDSAGLSLDQIVDIVKGARERDVDVVAAASPATRRSTAPSASRWPGSTNWASHEVVPASARSRRRPRSRSS